MQIFQLGTALETASNLDPHRLNRQVQEAGWIVNSTENTMRHPCAKMYKDHHEYLGHYIKCFYAYRTGDYKTAEQESVFVEELKPEFVSDTLIDSHKSRLYQKAPELYRQYKDIMPECPGHIVNRYYVDGAWLFYVDSKKMTEPEFEEELKKGK